MLHRPRPPSLAELSDLLNECASLHSAQELIGSGGEHFDAIKSELLLVKERALELNSKAERILNPSSKAARIKRLIDIYKGTLAHGSYSDLILDATSLKEYLEATLRNLSHQLLITERGPEEINELEIYFATAEAILGSPSYNNSNMKRVDAFVSAPVQFFSSHRAAMGMAKRNLSFATTFGALAAPSLEGKTRRTSDEERIDGRFQFFEHSSRSHSFVQKHASVECKNFNRNTDASDLSTLLNNALRGPSSRLLLIFTNRVSNPREDSSFGELCRRRRINLYRLKLDRLRNNARIFNLAPHCPGWTFFENPTIIGIIFEVELLEHETD